MAQQCGAAGGAEPMFMGGMMDGGAHMPFSAPPFGRGRPMPDGGPMLMGMPPFGAPYLGEASRHDGTCRPGCMLARWHTVLGAGQLVRKG